MKESRLFEVVPLPNSTMLIIHKEDGNKVALYRVSPYASYMLTAQLTNDIIEAYEKYFRAILRNVNTQR